jgi:Ca2+-binding EF-hand superfamily protein
VTRFSKTLQKQAGSAVGRGRGDLPVRLARLTLFAILIATTLAITGSAQSRVGEELRADSDADVRHVVLMLERAPLHLRLRIQIGGESLTVARREFLSQLMQQLDVDADGLVSRVEAERSPLLRQAGPAPESEFLESLAADQLGGNINLEESVTRVAGETMTYRQEDSASQSDESVFELLDDDASGVIDGAEMATAADRLRELDADRDQCVGYDEVQPPPDEPAQDALLAATAPQQPAARATFSELVRDTRDPLLARRLLRKYDRDFDGRLSDAELQWGPDRIAQIDGNRDGSLSVAELRDIAASDVDLALDVDLLPGDQRQPRLTVADQGRGGIDVTAAGSTVHVQFDDATVTFSCLDADPIAEALASSRRRFNQLDADGNGYLDAVEVQTDVRLRRGLFDAIDADGDGKLFGQELESYVRGCGEPAAMTCRLNVHDTGSGFYQRLDANSDGRISERELRTLEQSLAGLNRDEQPGVTLEEPTRHFHIEFVRGAYRLFGPTETIAAQLPTFQRGVRTGPIWFQRMDRNNDGDLTWEEFLGHREDFHRIDADGDGLIDAHEAEQAATN